MSYYTLKCDSTAAFNLSMPHMHVEKKSHQNMRRPDHFCCLKFWSRKCVCVVMEQVGKYRAAPYPSAVRV